LWRTGDCFVLTNAGVLAARELARMRGDPIYLDRPDWQADVHELWYLGQRVKKFRHPAPHQELILTAFQEQDWVRHIFDPLPGLRDGQDPRRRLRDAIRGLNDYHENPLLRFHSNGGGDGICWEAVPNGWPSRGQAVGGPGSARRASGSGKGPLP
jgi:hypothetical protein